MSVMADFPSGEPGGHLPAFARGQRPGSRLSGGPEHDLDVDARWGEIVVVVVVPEAGTAPHPGEVTAYCRARPAGPPGGLAAAAASFALPPRRR
ncbi:MAG TPA: hypothetical protein VF933_00675 [Streptosporangiaceae bacterium]